MKLRIGKWYLAIETASGIFGLGQPSAELRSRADEESDRSRPSFGI